MGYRAFCRDCCADGAWLRSVAPSAFEKAFIVKKQTRRLVVAMLLAVCVYAAFAIYSGYHDLASRLSTYSWMTFVLACALAFANYLVRFIKWEYYLRLLKIEGVPKFDSLLIFLSGFVLTVTPGKVGEVFKSLLLFETHRVPIARTATIVVAERLTDVIGIVVLIVLGSLGFSGGLIWAGIGAAAVGLCLVVIVSGRLSELAIRSLERLPGPFRRIAPKVREAWASLRLMTSPGALVIPAFLSVGSWALEGLALWVILRGFGAAVGLAPAVFFYSTSTLAGALIPVPGGLGVTEGALEEQLRVVGAVDGAVATGSMILVRFATLWFAVLVGFVALGWLRARYPALKNEAGPPAAAIPGTSTEA